MKTPKRTHLLASAFPNHRHPRPLCGAEIHKPYLFVPQEGDLRGVTAEDLAKTVQCRKCLQQWDKACKARFSYLAAVRESQEALDGEA